MEQNAKLSPEELRCHIAKISTVKAIPHEEILDELLKQIKPIDFRKLSGVPVIETLKQRDYRISIVEEVIRAAKASKREHYCKAKFNLSL